MLEASIGRCADTNAMIIKIIYTELMPRGEFFKEIKETIVKTISDDFLKNHSAELLAEIKPEELINLIKIQMAVDLSKFTIGGKK